MAGSIQKQIDRTIGLANADLSDVVDLDTIIPHIASSCPACTVADLSENVGIAIARVEEAVKKLTAYKAALDAKAGNQLVVVACMPEVESSFLFDEKECGSSLGWLLGPAIKEYRAGNRDAIDRYVEAAAHLGEAYRSDAVNNFEHPANMLSDVFEAYCERAEAFVKGRLPTFSRYPDFIARIQDGGSTQIL